jgi:hypothetical protein
MAEVTPEFAAMAKVALGTDDPERIAALKEAIVICVEEREAGGYEEEESEGMGGGGMGEMATLFGGG